MGTLTSARAEGVVEGRATEDRQGGPPQEVCEKGALFRIHTEQIALPASKYVHDRVGKHVQVFEKTFAAVAHGGRPVLYVTERAVFRLCPGEGIELMEGGPWHRPGGAGPGPDGLPAHRERRPRPWTSVCFSREEQSA